MIIVKFPANIANFFKLSDDAALLNKLSAKGNNGRIFCVLMYHTEYYQKIKHTLVAYAIVGERLENGRSYLTKSIQKAPFPPGLPAVQH